MPLMRTRPVMTELRRQAECNEREYALNRRAHRENLELCARLIERNAASMDAMVHAVAENTRAVHELRVEMREEFREMRAAIEDLTAAVHTLVVAVNEMRAEVRAQTQAIFQLVDRIDRLDSGPAAA